MKAGSTTGFRAGPPVVEPQKKRLRPMPGAEGDRGSPLGPKRPAAVCDRRRATQRGKPRCSEHPGYSDQEKGTLLVTTEPDASPQGDPKPLRGNVNNATATATADVQIRESRGVLRAFTGTAVTAMASRQGADADWPGTWVVSYPVATRAEAERILRERACYDHAAPVPAVGLCSPAREPFGPDYFLEDLFADTAFAHRIVRSGEDAAGWYAECVCPWQITGRPTADQLASEISDHIALAAADAALSVVA